MNPPIRTLADKLAMLEAVCDGTVDMIATDHAPHSAEEKSKGLADSMMGVVGLETAFPALWTGLVKTGLVPIETLISALSDNPRRRFGYPIGKDFSIWNLDVEKIVDPNEFLSMGRSTPFAGQTLYGENLLTVADGKIVYVKHTNA